MAAVWICCHHHYALGENFKSEMDLYAIHLWRDYVYLGIPLAVVGAAALFRARRSWFALAMTGWLVTGPIFIFLGNLPPNTHAVAILEAAYLMPDVFFLLFVAAGLASWGFFCATLEMDCGRNAARCLSAGMQKRFLST